MQKIFYLSEWFKKLLKQNVYETLYLLLKRKYVSTNKGRL